MTHLFALLLLSLPALPPVQDDGFTQADLERVAREIEAEIEELRGQRFLRPVQVKIADKATFIEETTKRLDGLLPPGLIEGVNELARMLALLPPDGDLLEITLAMAQDAAGGFYIPGSDTFWLMEGVSGGLAKSILSHELVHALDDQHHDIDAKMRELLADSDAGYAYSAVVEGCAMNVQSAWMLRYLDPGELDFAELMRITQEATDAMVEHPAFVWVPFLSAYTSGAGFLVRGGRPEVLASGDDIRRAFTDPPRSSEQVLHPAKYWDPEQRDEPLAIEFDRSTLGESWSVVHEDTLGELALAILVRTLSDSTPFDPGAARYTNEVAAGWGGDRAIVLAQDDARFLRLVTAWDTERDAAEFFGAASLLVPALERNLEAVSREARGDTKPRTVATIAYGASSFEVVLSLGYGLRRARAREAAENLTYRVTPR